MCAYNFIKITPKEYIIQTVFKIQMSTLILTLNSDDLQCADRCTSLEVL